MWSPSKSYWCQVHFWVRAEQAARILWTILAVSAPFLLVSFLIVHFSGVWNA